MSSRNQQAISSIVNAVRRAGLALDRKAPWLTTVALVNRAINDVWISKGAFNVIKAQVYQPETMELVHVLEGKTVVTTVTSEELFSRLEQLEKAGKAGKAR